MVLLCWWPEGVQKTNNSHDEKQKCIAGAAEDDQVHQSDSWASNGAEPSFVSARRSRQADRSV